MGAGFASMAELSLFTLWAWKKCAVLEGHALRIQQWLKQRPQCGPEETRPSSHPFLKLAFFFSREGRPGPCSLFGLC